MSSLEDITEAVRERYAAKATEIAERPRDRRLDARALGCTLDDATLATRRQEWAVLEPACEAREARDGQVVMTYQASPATRAELTRLVAAENLCCADAVWELADEGERLVVTVTPRFVAGAASCCIDDCCGGSYSAAELESLAIDPRASLGCGNPTLLADLHPGETVLDLGSGAGIDVLLSARRVAPNGHAYGVDMTDEMVGLARENQARAGVPNATFLKGTIEQVPLPSESVDVVLSNCVINLAADKSAVLREAYRVLRPGGRFAVADMVALRELPAEVKARLDAWAGCVAGTITIDEYTTALGAAGFTGIDVEVTDAMAAEGAVASAYLRATKPA